MSTLLNSFIVFQECYEFSKGYAIQTRIMLHLHHHIWLYSVWLCYTESTDTRDGTLPRWQSCPILQAWPPVQYPQLQGFDEPSRGELTAGQQPTASAIQTWSALSQPKSTEPTVSFVINLLDLLAYIKHQPTTSAHVWRTVYAWTAIDTFYATLPHLSSKRIQCHFLYPIVPPLVHVGGSWNEGLLPSMHSQNQLMVRGSWFRGSKHFWSPFFAHTHFCTR